MPDAPPCPECRSAYVYPDGDHFVCPECAHEWSAVDAPDDDLDVRDANGARLADGDTVTVVKDLKLKGGGGTIKVGTRVRNIRLVGGDHNIDCRIDGVGAMALKSEFVRKA